MGCLPFSHILLNLGRGKHRHLPGWLQEPQSQSSRFVFLHPIPILQSAKSYLSKIHTVLRSGAHSASAHTRQTLLKIILGPLNKIQIFQHDLQRF